MLIVSCIIVDSVSQVSHLELLLCHAAYCRSLWSPRALLDLGCLLQQDRSRWRLQYESETSVLHGPEHINQMQKLGTYWLFLSVML